MVLVHSLMRWVVLLAAIAAVVGYGRARARDVLDPLAERLGALYAAAIGIQLLLGVVLWLTEGRWSGDDVFLSFIHPVMMLIATGIASAGVARARRNSSATTGLVAVLASLVVVILAVPSTAWPL
jgi:hypothetical protein